MKEIKIKLKESDKAIKLLFVQNKQTIGTETRYINKCIICKKTTVDELNFGEKHICPECLEIIKERHFKDEQKNVAKSVKVRTKRKRVVQKKEVQEKAGVIEAPKQERDVSKFARYQYKPTIEIVDYLRYKDLMHRGMNKELATMLVDLVLKGVNSVNKMFKVINNRTKETLYIYLCQLVKVGMLCPVGKLTKQSRYTRLFRVNSTLEYVNI